MARWLRWASRSEDPTTAAAEAGRPDADCLWLAEPAARALSGAAGPAQVSC